MRPPAPGPCLCLVLLLLLLLLLPAAAGEEPGDTWWARTGGPAARRVGRGLRNQARAVTALSRKYWAYVSCRVWPQDCDPDQKAASEAPGWPLPILGQQYMDILSSWFCHFKECCDREDCRITNNITGLEMDLSTRLHGQHLAHEVVLKSVKGFLSVPQPEKPLALSFHGWSGTGKNFVTRMLADRLYRDGLESECVQVFISTLHFPHLKYVDMYKEKLMKEVSDTVQRCGQALFVFDEAEKLPPSLLETLKPFLDHYDTIREVDYRRTIFLFLSNLGGNTINEVVLSWIRAGRSREEITMEDLEPRLQAEILKSTGSWSWKEVRVIEAGMVQWMKKKLFSQAPQLPL